MKTSAQVVIIGGGVVGCSVLYHLTKAGWTDVVLLERKELTSGSTWHAAGGMHTINGDPNVAKLQDYTVNLYKEIEAISGQDCGIHLTGGLLLADTKERLEWFKMVHARCRYLGIDTEIITLDEAEKLFPFLDKSKFVGALYDPVEGHVDPTGVTLAYAKSAQIAGAEIYKHTFVSGLTQKADKSWMVQTDKGEIHAEHVVNAGGLWAREVGHMVGLELPVLAMEHMYLLTDEIPELMDFANAQEEDVIGVTDFGAEIYMRKEGNGLLLGTYEKACVPWSEKTTPWDFDTELLQPDLDRIAPSLEMGAEHFPMFGRAGIKKVINGPFTFAPDGNPLVGPVTGIPNYWLACGVMAGLSQGGGVGLSLANWMVHGDPGADIWGMDNARFGDWATKSYTNVKVRENYSRRFRITFPNEELPAGRPLQTTPIYDRLTQENAVWGASYGLEHPLWFQHQGKDPIEDITFKRSNAFEVVAEECAAVRETAAMSEVAAFAKYHVTGSGAKAWLEHILTNTLPKHGRMALTPMLNHAGKLIGDFTVASLSDNDYYIFGSGIAENYHMRWFLHNLPSDGNVNVRAEGQRLVGLTIAGPNSRAILQNVVNEDVSNEAFKFLDFKKINVGIVPAMIGRISFTGDLGYEIWVRPEYLVNLYQVLKDAGKAYSMKLFGMRALNSLRFDKNFGSWGTEYRPIYGPYEAGLGYFVKLKKNSFIGKEAAEKEKETAGERKLVSFVLDAKDADAIADEPISYNGEVVGWVTSGGYAHHSQKSVALGYIPTELAKETSGFQIEIIGEWLDAKRLDEPLFDPKGLRMRS